MIIPMKNKYIIHSRISEKKFVSDFEVFFYFAYAHSFARSFDIEASKISKSLTFQRLHYGGFLSKFAF